MLINGSKIIEIISLEDLYVDYKDHRRLKVFFHKGLKCVCCNNVGTRLIKTLDKNGGKHIDLYTDDLILMTVDHIIPKIICKREGWPKELMEALENKQPMCTLCNNAKGKQLIDNDELLAQRVNIINTKALRRLYKDNRELTATLSLLSPKALEMA